jgi:hypothetical protein
MVMILAAGAWPTNAHLIEDVARLHFVPGAHVLDVTYGRGKWWTRYQPQYLLAHDKYTLDGVDFRDLPEACNTVDTVAFDPPYVSMGGRTTSTLGDMTDRYGMIDAPRTPADLRAYIRDGLRECARVASRIVIVKCQDYISSGTYQPATNWLFNDALGCGLVIRDRFEHVTRLRPQPPGRRQVHARRNLSTLFVFEAS